MRGSPPDTWFLVGCRSPFVQLAEQLTGASASRFGTRDVCLVGGKSDVLRPGAAGVQGPMVYGFCSFLRIAPRISDLRRLNELGCLVPLFL